MKYVKIMNTLMAHMLRMLLNCFPACCREVCNREVLLTDDYPLSSSNDKIIPKSSAFLLLLHASHANLSI